MRSRLIITFALCLCVLGVGAQTKTQLDSAKAEVINREAMDENFIQAYLMVVGPGKVFYSVYGHTAIRLVCPKKNLDYCFTFEMDMHKSHYVDIFTRKAYSGFTAAKTEMFIDQYRKEGRSMSAYRLTLKPKQKQRLWQVLDEEVKRGSTWTFDYTTANCLTMALYALGKALMPEQVKFKRMPMAVYGVYGDWMDYVSRNSPWVGVIMHTVLSGVDGSTLTPEDKLSPDMLASVLPHAVIQDSIGKQRPLVSGAPQTVLPATFEDTPCWFSPKVALVLVALIVLLTAGLLYWKHNEKR